MTLLAIPAATPASIAFPPAEKISAATELTLGWPATTDHFYPARVGRNALGGG